MECANHDTAWRGVHAKDGVRIVVLTAREAGTLGLGDGER